MAKSVAEVAHTFSQEMEVAADNLDRETVENAAEEALIPLALDMKARAPIDEGDLVESIRVEKFSENPHKDLGPNFIGGAMVGPTVFYALFVQIGADQPAQPFVRNVVEKHRDELIDRFAERLFDSIFEEFA